VTVGAALGVGEKLVADTLLAHTGFQKDYGTPGEYLFAGLLGGAGGKGGKGKGSASASVRQEVTETAQGGLRSLKSKERPTRQPPDTANTRAVCAH
jgi:hypothetical protein